MGKPIFFCQIRPGYHCKPFQFYKFRTMGLPKPGQDDPQYDAQRLTQLGKFLRKYSLDELPQLFNVLKGNLSLVGPRPLLMEYLPLYSSEQLKRHNVVPGITGWAQINGRNTLSWEEKFQLDLWYVEHRCLWLNIKILAITLIKLIKPQGINQPGCATMEKFKGH
jgi:sugar transferase EpsL